MTRLDSTSYFKCKIAVRSGAGMTDDGVAPLPTGMDGVAAEAAHRSSSPFVILCDAGSTGTRLYVYSLPLFGPRDVADPTGGGSSLLSTQHNVQIQEGPKVKPGLSAQTPESARRYLAPAFAAALGMIPEEFHAATPVYVYATAGMRLLPEETQLQLYDSLAQALADDPDVPFLIDRSNFRTITGDDEGYFAALAVNYLGGLLGSDLIAVPPPAASSASSDHGRLPDGGAGRRFRRRNLSFLGRGNKGSNSAGGGGPTLFGALDLGGASVQIVFDASTMTLDGRRRLQRNVQSQNRRYLEIAGREGAARSTHRHMYNQQWDAGVADTGHTNLRALSMSSPPLPNGARSVSREDFFCLSLLGYGGQSMRASVDAYLERPEVRERIRSLGGKTRDEYNGERRRRVQAANLVPVPVGQRSMKKHKGKEFVVEEPAHGEAGLDSRPNSIPIIQNPCYPPGYSATTPSGFTHMGFGDGSKCMITLDAVMEENAQGVCKPGQFCVDLLGDGIEPPVWETFYAFTLYSYPLNFVREVIAKIKEDNGGKIPHGKEYHELRDVNEKLKFDNPSIESLEEVTKAACKWEYSYLVEALPNEDQAANRCMELGLATSLLKKFGFPKDGHNIHFTDEIGGASAEWTLGAYLHLLNHDSRNSRSRGWRPADLISSKMSVLNSDVVNSDVAILTFALLTLAICVRLIIKRSWLDSMSHHAKSVVTRAAPSRSLSMPVG